MKVRSIVFAFCLLITLAIGASAQSVAPGGPGKDAQWATAAKQGVGTSATTKSKVWFTLAQGVMTEVYYPDVTVANVHLLQFVVVNPKTKKVETEQDDAIHTVHGLPMSRREKIFNLPTTTSISRVPVSEFYRSAEFPGSMAFRQVSTSKSGEWSILKTVLVDPEANSVVISVDFEPKTEGLELYLYYDPSLANSGLNDTAWTDGRFLLAQDGAISSALTCGRCNFDKPSNGFLGENDGLTQLRQNGSMSAIYERAERGNVVQTAKVVQTQAGGGRNQSMIFVLSFAADPAAAKETAFRSLSKGFDKSYQEYQAGWFSYLRNLPRVDPKYQAQFNMAAMQLKAHEDKANPGANIASMSVPWGGGANANEPNIGGYHLVWSRDLYQVFTAFMAIGDTAAANRALDFLFKVQQKPDGSFPQNSWLDGRPFWGSLQMDEVAYPLIMAYELKRFDKATWENHVKKAADFIVKNGPSTPQERWEEEAGYSPSTIAAEIAGLVCAAEIARRNGDTASAELYLKTADEWEANIEKWTVTKTGPHSKEPYYIRIAQNGKPDAGDKIELNNGAGTFDEREIVDAGFLELVRLGIRPADDPIIINSLKVIDKVIKVETPNGPAFYRYNNDGYGEMDDGRRWNWDGKYTGKGRLWVLLSGERGQYEIAAANTPVRYWVTGTQPRDFFMQLAGSRLDHMLAFANEGLMIPEQVWDKKETPRNIDKQFIPELKFGEGTGSATPLAWSMAQFIRLATNLKAGRNLDTPDIVYQRYAGRRR